MCTRIVVVFLVCQVFSLGRTWSDDNDRVLLENVKAITLFKGRITNGRRSVGVPQLRCVGGSAGCSAFVPTVVQCQNVGSDGFDVQWECKADMDDSYRFGKIQVSCEGYDYPNDNYVLKGSCGLEYTIDYTEAGQRRSSNYFITNFSNQSGSWIFFFLILGIIAVVIYKMRSANNQYQPDDQHHPPPPPHHHHSHHDHPGGSPPPYGFKPEYSRSNTPPPTYSSTTHGPTSSRAPYNNGNGQPGFWTGMGVGGLGGYLFGSRRNSHRGYHNPGYGPGYGGGYGSAHDWGWGSTGGGGYGSSSSVRSRNSGSSTTRTASGFGGTSRR